MLHLLHRRSCKYKYSVYVVLQKELVSDTYQHRKMNGLGNRISALKFLYLNSMTGLVSKDWFSPLEVWTKPCMLEWCTHSRNCFEKCVCARARFKPLSFICFTFQYKQSRCVHVWEAFRVFFILKYDLNTIRCVDLKQGIRPITSDTQSNDRMHIWSTFRCCAELVNWKQTPTCLCESSDKCCSHTDITLTLAE